MLPETDIAGLLEEAVKTLVAVEHGATRSIVQTPITLPSGTLLGLRVSADTGGFTISDGGAAYEEARMMRATRSFGSHAPAIADETGVVFDGKAFLLQRVGREALPGALIAVANASSTIATLFSHRQAAIDARDAEERLFARLTRIFGAVETHHSVRGVSGTEWDVDAIVRRDDKVILFDSVSARKQSIYATVAKFHDIARSPDAPQRVAAVSSREALGSMLGVLSQAATVMEEDTPDASIRRLAA